MESATELQNHMGYYTGTEQYHFNPLNRNILYTDGARFFFENAGGGAYWLLDILITQPEILNALKQEGFLYVTLTVTPASTAVLMVANDSGEYATVYYRREIEYTDCPAGEWRLYMIGNVILLPSEY